MVMENSPANIIPSDHEMMVFHTMAEQAIESKMYRGIGDKAGVMMVMLAARELGIPPMQALNGGINIISGKIEISARMMSAMIRRAKHSIQILETSDSICTLKGRRADNGDLTTVCYTIADAQKAGLVKTGGGWVKNPKDMCFARALSRLARQLFSDVIGIGYVEGEIKPTVYEEINPMHEVRLITETPLEELEKILQEMVEKEDEGKLMEYVQLVQDHYGWTREMTVKEFLSDQVKTKARFLAWKGKV